VAQWLWCLINQCQYNSSIQGLSRNGWTYGVHLLLLALVMNTFVREYLSDNYFPRFGVEGNPTLDFSGGGLYSMLNLHDEQNTVREKLQGSSRSLAGAFVLLVVCVRLFAPFLHSHIDPSVSSYHTNECRACELESTQATQPIMGIVLPAVPMQFCEIAYALPSVEVVRSSTTSDSRGPPVRG
jgi:hypothetical protein